MTFTSSPVPVAFSTLASMLRYKRPHKSKGEAAFIKRFILPLGVEADAFGNYWKRIGDSPILWSCHLDTVHRTTGPQGLTYGDGLFYSNSGECLGGDDTAGIFIMSEMIRKEVPGLYIFHRGEECGGLGSQWIANNAAKRLEGISFAIALDRKGTGDIITDQMGETASKGFALSLARALAPMVFAPCAQGIFTDTANYAHLIPECTNLSVGYEHAHQASECLRAPFVVALAKRMCEADFSALSAERTPQEPSYNYNVEYGAFLPRGHSESQNSWRHQRFMELIRDDPEGVASFLENQGYYPWELRDFVQ